MCPAGCPLAVKLTLRDVPTPKVRAVGQLAEMARPSHDHGSKALTFVLGEDTVDRTHRNQCTCVCSVRWAQAQPTQPAFKQHQRSNSTSVHTHARHSLQEQTDGRSRMRLDQGIWRQGTQLKSLSSALDGLGKWHVLRELLTATPSTTEDMRRTAEC